MVVCKKCGTDKIKKDGKMLRQKYTVQQYKCLECKSSWTERIEVPIVNGITAQERTDFDGEIMPYLKMIGEKAKAKNQIEANQTITMPNKPFAIALMADLHGGGKSDYEAIEKDIELIRKTEGMYAGNVGDNTDNFIIGALQNIQKEQPTTFQMEVRFAEWLMRELSGSLLFWVSGNHNNWTKKVSGIDFFKEGLKGTQCLYDPIETRFILKWGDNEVKVKVRHKWRYSSIFNPTHGIEVGWERIGQDFDIGIGAHTHIATLCRSFIREERKRYAVLLGTYKIRDTYGRKCGFANSVGSGSGGFCFHPDGRYFWCEDLITLRDLLRTWQEECN